MPCHALVQCTVIEAGAFSLLRATTCLRLVSLVCHAFVQCTVIEAGEFSLLRATTCFSLVLWPACTHLRLASLVYFALRHALVYSALRVCLCLCVCVCVCVSVSVSVSLCLSVSLSVHIRINETY